VAGSAEEVFSLDDVKEEKRRKKCMQKKHVEMDLLMVHMVVLQGVLMMMM
jgi:hypothetical protein